MPQHDVAIGEGPALGELQRLAVIQPLDQSPAGAKKDGDQDSLVFVDQIGLRQLRDDAAAAQYHEIL